MYEPLAARFPELTQDDLASRVPTGERRWESKVRFARLKLVERGLLYPAKDGPSPKRGPHRRILKWHRRNTMAQPPQVVG